MKELNEEQIAFLFEFIRKRNVPHLDVQYELVDHLASAVEDEMHKDEDLTFRQSLKIVYGRFPITGFALFQLEKEKGLKTYWRRRFWAYMSGYIRMPKIILSFLLISTISLLLINVKLGLFYIMASYWFASLLSLIYLRRHKQINKLKKENSFLAVKTFVENSGLIDFTTFAIVTSQIHPFYEYPIVISNTYIAVFVSVFAALAFLWLHAMTFVFPHMMEEDLKVKYSHIIQYS